MSYVISLNWSPYFSAATLQDTLCTTRSCFSPYAGSTFLWRTSKLFKMAVRTCLIQHFWFSQPSSFTSSISVSHYKPPGYSMWPNMLSLPNTRGQGASIKTMVPKSPPLLSSTWPTQPFTVVLQHQPSKLLSIAYSLASGPVPKPCPLNGWLLFLESPLWHQVWMSEVIQKVWRPK